MRRKLMGVFMLAGVATSAFAADTAPNPLPSLALNPPPEPSIWHGFWVGTSVVAAGGRGTRGFVGGDVSAGYDHVFANTVILGLHAATGIAPGYSAFGAIRGYDFATLGAKIAYPAGRWTPYMTTDLIVAKPNERWSGGFSALDAVNSVFNGAEKLDVGGQVGAGFDYAVTNETSIGLGVAVHRGPAGVFP